MDRRRVFAVLAAGAVALGLPTGFGPPAAGSGTASSRLGCPTAVAPAVSRPAPAGGAGVWVAAAGRVVRPDGWASLAAPVGPAAVVDRHVVTVEGVATAFVEDRRGADTLVLATRDGVVRLPQRVEATNPALSASGDLAWSIGSEIRVRDGATGRIRRLPVPVDGARGFAPVFVGDHGALDVVLSSPPTPAVPQDEWLNQIWRVSAHGTWHRTTDFHADDDRWTAIRTPVAAPEGGVEFILVRGRGSTTAEPRFLLMHLDRTGPQRLRTLDREMYLAGFDGDARMWNVPDIAGLRADLLREEPDGSMQRIGCGATLMDPIDVVDPDHAAVAPDGSPSPAVVAEPRETASTISGSEIGLLIGDFATSGGAEAAAAAIRAAYGSEAPVRVVTSETAPHAVRPGVYGALLALSAAEDPSRALATFRAKLPLYSSSSWVVTA